MLWLLHAEGQVRALSCGFRLSTSCGFRAASSCGFRTVPSLWLPPSGARRRDAEGQAPAARTTTAPRPAHCPKTGEEWPLAGSLRSSPLIPPAGTKSLLGGTDGQNQWMKGRFTLPHAHILIDWPVPCTAQMRFPARRNCVWLRLTHNAEVSRERGRRYETACRSTARHNRGWS